MKYININFFSVCQRTLLYYFLYMMLCAIWYHLSKLKTVKNAHGGVLLSVKLQAFSLQLYKSNTLPWVFFTFFKFYKWYQIAQSMTYDNMSSLKDIISSRNCSNVTGCSCRIFRCTEGLVKLLSLIPPYSIFLLPTH